MDYIGNWNELKERYLKDIELLMNNDRDISAMLIICAFIDIVASFYQGRDSEKGVKKSFREFSEKYLSDFKRVSFGDLLFNSDKNEKVNDLIDLLYFCYRNGLIHEGRLPKGIELIRNSDFLCKNCAVGTMELNILGMYHCLLNAVHLFEKDLFNDSLMQEKYKKRMMYLDRPRFKKESIQ